jgi:outer membrane protein OmpA-like peptidoglycan-associated protein
MKTNCLKAAKTNLMFILLLAVGTQIQGQTPQTGMNTANKVQFNKLGFGLRLNHLYDVKFTAYDRLANGFSGEDLSGLNGSKTKFDLAFGVDVIYFFSPLVSTDLSFDMGNMTGANSLDYYESQVSFLTLGLNYDLKGRNRNKPYTWVPFVRGSVARATYDTKRKFIEDDVVFNTEEGTALQVGLGAGIRYHLTDNIHLNLQSEFITTYTDAWDGYNYGSGKDHMAKTSLAIRYTIGSKKHQDRGVAWQFSNQPNVADNSELVKQLLKSVSDSLSTINNRVAQLQSDNAQMRNQLNEDTDGDGVPNIKDLCPTVKGTMDNGCNEVKQAEPVVVASQPAAVVNIPNPVVQAVAPVASIGSGSKQEIKNMLLIEMNKIYFSPGSSRLNARDRSILNQSAKILKANPSFKVSILGYADQVGSNSTNQRLSKERAENVANYLVKQGVAKASLTSKAMGKQKIDKTDDLIRTNALNRRVEFIVE